MIELVIDGQRYAELHAHLFQADRDEHAAVILAGIDSRDGDVRLLTRELHLVEEDSFPPGVHGYRQTDARAVAEFASRAEDQRLAYVALHSHPGASRAVSLSMPDREAHRRLFPHLRDITGGAPVAGLALGQESAAGEVWLGDDAPAELDRVRVVGSHVFSMTDKPSSGRAEADERFDRQARLFGARGQELLRAAHVAVIGAGGGGSMLVEQLAHLGVGHITVVDFDVVKRLNLSRIVGATPRDARRGRKKVDVLADLVRRIDPECEVTSVDGDLTDLQVVEQVLDCDLMFLATDTIASRLVFNAIVHRYLIPGIQIGAKVEVSKAGNVDQIYVAVRPVWPHTGCLQCNSLISPEALQRENRTDEEAVAQNYLDEPEVIDPSVVTLNGIGASHAATVFLLAFTGLADDEILRHRLFFPSTGESLDVSSRQNSECRFCGQSERSEFALGGSPASLPVRRSATPVADLARRPGFLGRVRRRLASAVGLSL